MFDREDDDALYDLPCNEPFCPFMRQQGGPGFGPGYGPPKGGPGHKPQGPSKEGPPQGPPPHQVPKHGVSKGIVTKAVSHGAIQPCRHRYVYLWLDNGREFWTWLNYVDSRSAAGWRWNGQRWVYFGIDLRRIDSFECY
jgi:hypothetical protein